MSAISVQEIVERLKNELEPSVKSAAASAAASAAVQSAAQATSRDMARTREWFETKALPKAVRVAQRETFDMLRKQGRVEEHSRSARVGLEVGRPAEVDSQPSSCPLSPAEVREMAETCVALWEAQGKSIEATLSEISAEGGGWLLTQDTGRVREAARALLHGGGEGQGA